MNSKPQFKRTRGGTPPSLREIRHKWAIGCQLGIVLTLLLGLHLPTGVGLSLPPGSPTTLSPVPVSQSVPEHTPPAPPMAFSAAIEEQQAQAAMQAVLDKYLRYWGPRYQVAPVKVSVEGEWAHGVAEWQSETRTFKDAINLVAHRLPDGTWQARMPGTEGLYLAWVEAMPETLLPADKKLELQAQAVEADAREQSSALPEAQPMATPTPPTKEPAEGPGEPVLRSPNPTSTPTPQPQYVTSPDLAGVLSILSDGQFVYGPNVGAFDLAVFLESQSGILKQDEYQVVVHDQSTYYSINPKVLLTIIEMQSDLVTDPQPTPDAITNPIGYPDLPGFVPQMQRLGKRLSTSFYLYLYDYQLHPDKASPVELTLSDNSSVRLPKLSNAGTYAVQAALADVLDTQQWLDAVSLDSPDGFYQTYLRLFPDDDPLDPSNTIIPNSTPPSGLFKLPYTCNDTWYFYQGPHDWDGCCNSSCPTAPRSSVDFGPGTNCSDAIPTNEWITAAAAGTVTSVSCNGCMVVIDHGDGWQSRYYHVANVAVSQGQVVSKDANIGNPSCRPSYGDSCGSCDGWAQGKHHVHFAIYQNGYQPIDGTSLEGWIVHETGCYAGYLQNGGTIVDEGGMVTSECAPPPSCPQSGGVILYWNNNYNCDNGEGDPGYRQRTGTGWENISGAFNDQASSLKVPPGWSVQLYEHSDRGGAHVCRNGDDNDFGGDFFDGGTVPLNDHVSSFEVFDNTNCSAGPQCNPSADQVALYADTNYGGSTCVTLNVGEYPNPGYLNPLGNDNAESVKVGSNVWANLCENDLYGGRCEPFTGDDSNLWDNYIGGNAVSSVSVQWETQAPSAPTLQSPANGSSHNEGTSFTLVWNSASGATEYYAEYWGGPAGTIGSGWQSGTSWYIGSQWAGYTYSWHVKARNGSGESGWSDTWTFVVRPAAPSNLSTQTPSCNQVNLYWSDNSGNEEGYKIYRNGSYVGQVGMNGTSYQDTGLSGNTSYSYYVKAFRGSIESDPSNTVNVTTPPCGAPQPDLVPAWWEDWEYPIVPSSETGTTVVGTLFANQPTYVDWGVANIGLTDSGGDVYGEIYVDSILLARYNFGNVLAGQSWAFFDWPSWTQTEGGWHTLRVIADPDNFITEADENNNSWEHPFYWVSAAPYADNMESGINSWTATGLWHLVDEQSSPYAESHSWSHSWWYGQDATGNYDTGGANSGDLTSPSMYIPSDGYYLRFWYWYETETQGVDWDRRWIQISVDGGSFDNVLQLYDDPMNFWLQSPIINLSGYAGHTIQVRFHFDTADEFYNGYRGWYIDDFDISTAPPPTCADGYEPNNAPAQATNIAYGQTLNADICPGGDYDFYTFTGAAGDKAVIDIDAKVNGSSLDSYIFLLDSDGTSVLAEHDDEIPIEVQDSHLGYQLSHDGTYFIKVRAWNHPSAGGTDHFYTIHLLTDDANPSYAQITSPGSGTWLDPNLQTVSVAAIDNESGVSRVEFLWHDANWQDSEWVWLGADYDPRDGWNWGFDTSSLPDQQGSAFYIWAFDWVGNWAGAGAWNLGIDHNPRHFIYLPLVLKSYQIVPPTPTPTPTSTPGWHVECVDCPKFFSDMSDRTLALGIDGYPHIVYGGDHLYHAWYDGSQWHTEVVDGAAGVGRSASLALDTANHLHVGYYDATNHDVKYAAWDGTKWTVQTVDDQGEVGLGVSLALDSTSRPHLVYYDRSNGDLKYARWNGTAWIREIVDDSASWWWGGQTSLALDSQDHPHVSYRQGNDGSLKYATRTGGTWISQTIDTQMGAYVSSSIAIGPEGYPHISYGAHGVSPHEIRYASWNSTSWEIQTVAQIGDWGGYSSLAFDSAGRPHISFQDWNGDKVRYARWDGSMWIIEDVTSVGWWGGRNSLVLDATGQPYIAYHNWLPFQIRYAVKNGASWTSQTVDTGGDVGAWSSIDADSGGHLHISYQDNPNMDLKYALYNGATWATQTMDNSWSAGEHSALTLDSAGHPHISYRGDDHLKYAHWDGTNWIIQTVDANGNVGGYTSLTLDSSGYPHISYHDWDNQALKYATWNGQNWVLQTVDSIGDGGGCSYTSIAIGSDDNPSIAYYDADSQDLKVAHWNGTSWAIQIVDSDGDVGCSPAIAFDASGKPRVAYYDSSEGQLKYAAWNGTNWQIQTVVSQSTWAPRCALVLDANGRPRIAYTNGVVENDAMYADWDGTKWIIETIEEAGDVGSWISLALDPSGLPHVSYNDETNGALKHARRW